MTNERLKRSTTNRVIAGVCGGIAQRFGLDATLVRVAWVIAVFFAGVAVVAYVILWIVLPEDESITPAVHIAEERYAHGEILAEELERIREDLKKR